MIFANAAASVEGVCACVSEAGYQYEHVVEWRGRRCDKSEVGQPISGSRIGPQ
jgi:hypothetical protein